MSTQDIPEEELVALIEFQRVFEHWQKTPWFRSRMAHATEDRVAPLQGAWDRYLRLRNQRLNAK